MSVRNNNIGFRIMQIWVLGTVILFIIQFLSSGRIDLSALDFFLPGSAIAYVLGREDGESKPEPKEDKDARS